MTIFRRTTKSAPHSLPVVPRFRCLAETRRLLENPIAVLQRHTRQHGRTFRYHFGGARKVWITSDARIIQHVLKANCRAYGKSAIQTRQMVGFLGHGLLSDPWEEWKPKRQTLQKGFRAADLDAKAVLMRQALHEKLADFDNVCGTASVNLSPMLHAAIFTMTARALFGISMTSADTHQISVTVSAIQRFMVRQVFQPYLIPWFRLSGQVARHQRLRRSSDALLRQQLDAVRADSTVHEKTTENLLDILIEMTSGGTRLSDEQIMAEAMQMLVAGHETSANGLTWIITLLGQHPSWFEMMREEFAQVLGDRPVMFSDMRQLPITQAILDESLRMFPPFWILDRVALQEDEVGDWSLAKGEVVMCFLYGLHRDPKVWKQPGIFRPERFLNEPHPQRELIHIPFGAGPRRCIGELLARLQMTLLLQTLYGRYRIELTDAEIALEPRFTLSRKQGLSVWLGLR